MEKICFVVCQYGEEVNGGAEIHCKMLAERLSPYYKIDILTSKIINYNTFDEYYTSSKEVLNNIQILRFKCKEYNPASYTYWRKKTKWPRKIRRFLFRINILPFIANLIPIWNYGIKKEKELLENHGFYSPELINFLKDHKSDYQKIIFMSYPYPSTVFGIPIAPEKSILIPTVHNEGDVFRSIQTHVFTQVKHIAFNTEEEKNLTQKIFGKKMATNSIVAVGVDTDLKESIDDTGVLKKFNIADPYIHYFGRICNSKMGNLIEWFTDYKQKHPSELKLVLTGRLFQEKVQHADIIYTGFVSESEKIILIKNSNLVVNPSKNESLSLLLLETMKLGKMALVNGKSDVMKGHCIKSDFAVDYYLNKSDFQQKLHRFAFDEDQLNKNSKKSIEYVDKYYNWDVIIGKLRKIIDTY